MKEDEIKDIQRRLERLESGSRNYDYRLDSLKHNLAEHETKPHCPICGRLVFTHDYYLTKLRLADFNHDDYPNTTHSLYDEEKPHILICGWCYNSLSNNGQLAEKYRKELIKDKK